MGQAWTFDGAPATTMGAPSGLVTLLEGTTFCICETSGDLRPGGAQGLFVRDTRLISRLELSINGHVPEPLAPQSHEPFACTFLSRMPPMPGLADSTMLVARQAAAQRRHARGDHAPQHEHRAAPGQPADRHRRRLRRRVRGQGGPGARRLGGRRGADRRRRRRLDQAEPAGRLGPARSADHRHPAPRRRARGLGQPADLARGRARARRVEHVAADHAVAERPGPGRVPGRARASERRPAGLAGPEQRLADWRRQSPLVRASDVRLASVFAASTEDLGLAADLRPRARRPRGHRGGRAVVHDHLRPRLAAHLVDGPAARPVAGARHDADAGQPAGLEGDARRPRRSRARSCTRCGSACRRRCGWAAAASTTAPSTPRRCS